MNVTTSKTIKITEDNLYLEYCSDQKEISIFDKKQDQTIIFSEDIFNSMKILGMLEELKRTMIDENLGGNL